MTVLYDQSAAFNALVLGTSNKSELLLGYGTQFGDMASAINPIGDLYKTQLYPLAAHLGLPADILQKTPTGDLWIGQTDEGELGFTYAEVDRLMVLMVDRRWRRAELIDAGFAAGQQQIGDLLAVERIDLGQLVPDRPVGRELLRGRVERVVHRPHHRAVVPDHALVVGLHVRQIVVSR